MNDPPFKIDPHARDWDTGLIVRAYDPIAGEYGRFDVSQLDDESLIMWLKWSGQGAALVGVLLGRGPFGADVYDEAVKKAAALSRGPHHKGRR